MKQGQEYDHEMFLHYQIYLVFFLVFANVLFKPKKLAVILIFLRYCCVVLKDCLIKKGCALLGRTSWPKVKDFFGSLKGKGPKP